ncbi:putative AlkP superfamily pyrophosphatase or phosphodiesterase [Paenibacillus forsythiae]|uniref:AlkP superfamily pyrophosphatase or phosphodiesterase n=1 Tax=Paenibacillus forsythiae TaxID=365616 RepID=A0ABU3H285_9BACL|nr:alkaline phosphatase family protein [Paenibacillus forsythiae]MDT3424850.1 putative AlkP superfamily pyrophosphatase or phosphodiesterase [Paenibacillus forsythiae]
MRAANGMGSGPRIAVILTIGLTLIMSLGGCHPKSETNGVVRPQSEFKSKAVGNKPIVVIIIDSLMDKPLQEAMKQGRAPALKYLVDHGRYTPEVVSSFPTMSVTIDSTLLTGVYADKHHVPGLVWYSDGERRMVFYGNGPKEALKIDQLQVLTDSVYQMNQVQLSKRVKTIHEELADAGKHSASINAIIYRGRTQRDLRVPRAMANTSRLPDHYKITAPELFSLAAFAHLNPDNSLHTALWEKYGMNDKFTARDIAFLVKHGKLPEVTIGYFPGNDSVHHRKGSNALKGIERADRALQHVLGAFGSWDEAVSNATWIILGDSAQSDVLGDRDEFKVELLPLLNGYRIAKLGRPVGQDDQVVVAANERMAYIYAISPDLKLSELVKKLQAEDKLDIIAVKQDHSVLLTGGGKGNNVLTYRPGGPFLDEYGQKWSLSGAPDLADISLHGHRINYGQYPDVLARLYGALHSHEGRFVVVTVKPGYELAGESSPAHRGGGAHGSLHEADSIVPLIVTGTDLQPKHPRIVDLKNWILRVADRD